MIGGILQDLLSLFSGNMNVSRGMDDAQDQAETQAQRQKELVGALEDLTDTLQRINGIPANIPGGNFLQPVQQPASSVFSLAQKSSPASAVQQLGSQAQAGKSSWFGGIVQTVGGKLNGLGDKLGGLGQTASKAVGGLSGLLKFAGIAGAALLVTKALFDMAKAAHNFVTQQSESNRRLAMFSGQLSASFAKMDLEQMRRDMSMARNTGGTAAELNQARTEMENALQPIKEDVANIYNILATYVAKSITLATKSEPVLNAAFPVLGLLKMGLDKFLEEKVKIGEGSQAIEAFLQGFKNQQNLPPRAPLPPMRNP